MLGAGLQIPETPEKKKGASQAGLPQRAEAALRCLSLRPEESRELGASPTKPKSPAEASHPLSSADHSPSVPFLQRVPVCLCVFKVGPGL